MLEVKRFFSGNCFQFHTFDDGMLASGRTSAWGPLLSFAQAKNGKKAKQSKDANHDSMNFQNRERFQRTSLHPATIAYEKVQKLRILHKGKAFYIALTPSL